MNEERKRVLDLLGEGKINADEAERLLNALNAGARAEADMSGLFANVHRIRRHLHRMHEEHHGEHHGGHHSGRRRFVRIVVDKDTGEGRTERVRIKVPVKLLKAGISLAGLMPKDVREHVQEALKEKGIDVDPFALRGADTDEILAALHDLEIDIGKKGEKVRIFTADTDDEDEDDGGDEGGSGDGGGREAEGPGGEQTVERTIRRRRFRRDSGLSFQSVLMAPVMAAAFVAVAAFRLVLVPIAWLAFFAVRIVSFSWRVVTAPFRWIARGMVARASWRRDALTDRTIAA
jgi:Fe-S-cluster formation regulator IscX/YfhJ